MPSVITIYDDVILDDTELASNVRGKNIRVNTRTESQSGYVSVNVDSPVTRRQYEWGFVPLSPAAWQKLEALHEITDAGAFGFLMRDPKDALADAAPLQPLAAGAAVGAAGFGYGVPTLQLYKRYTLKTGGRSHLRRITRPMASPALLRGGVAVAYGAGAGQVAVSTTTGIATFVADVSQAITAITTGASTVIDFANGAGIVAALAVGDRVYLAGTAGTAAATLNGYSHAITAKGATSLTVGTATTGLAATGGTAYKYPQASESLTWSGGFYVPVHFASDSIDWEIVRSGPEAARLVVGPSVVAMEVRE